MAEDGNLLSESDLENTGRNSSPSLLHIPPGQTPQFWLPAFLSQILRLLATVQGALRGSPGCRPRDLRRGAGPDRGRRRGRSGDCRPARKGLWGPRPIRPTTGCMRQATGGIPPPPDRYGVRQGRDGAGRDGMTVDDRADSPWLARVDRGRLRSGCGGCARGAPTPLIGVGGADGPCGIAGQGAENCCFGGDFVKKLKGY